MTGYGYRRPDVVITGIGMVTPAGADTTTAWKATCAGLPAAAADPRLAGLAVDFSCPVTGFDPDAVLGTEARRMDPFTQYAIAAAREAVADAAPGDGGWDPARVGVALGTAVGGQRTWEEQGRRLGERGQRAVNPLTVPKAIGNIAAGSVAMDLGLHGPSFVLSTACAAGTTALGLALDLLRAGRCDVVLVSGTEAAVTPLVSTAFDRLKALSRRVDDPSGASRPFDEHRDGFVLGEGAAVLVLERADDARAREPASLRAAPGPWRLVGRLPSHLARSRRARCAARPAAGARRRAGRRRRRRTRQRPRDQHAPGRRGRSAPDRGRLRPGHRGDLDQGVTGHMLGAAGAVEAAFTALSIERGVIPPTANFGAPGADVAGIDIVHGASRRAPVSLAVSNSFGFGGHNAVVVLGSV